MEETRQLTVIGAKVKVAKGRKKKQLQLSSLFYFKHVFVFFIKF